MTTYHFSITPVPKPRMTQRDKWLTPARPAVAAYRGYCDEITMRHVSLPYSGAHVTFNMPMPVSWTQRKREQMKHQPHQQTPDVDNLLKALLDAVFGQDSVIWDIRATKVWSECGSITIETDHEFGLAEDF
ncbi:MAG: RusA family crossover junction endodeoxyribonuclease [Pseudomonadota bacterium]